MRPRRQRPQQLDLRPIQVDDRSHESSRTLPSRGPARSHRRHSVEPRSSRRRTPCDAGAHHERRRRACVSERAYRGRCPSNSAMRSATSRHSLWNIGAGGYPGPRVDDDGEVLAQAAPPSGPRRPASADWRWRRTGARLPGLEPPTAVEPGRVDGRLGSLLREDRALAHPARVEHMFYPWQHGEAVAVGPGSARCGRVSPPGSPQVPGCPGAHRSVMTCRSAPAASVVPGRPVDPAAVPGSYGRSPVKLPGGA